MNKRLPQIKKDISVFLHSEEAKIARNKSGKLSLGVISLFFILQAVNDAFASHTSSLGNPNKQGQHSSNDPGGGGCGFHISGW